MNPQGNRGFCQGRASNCHSLFCGNNFAYWCSLMQMFIIDQDLNIQDIIKNGPRQCIIERNGARSKKLKKIIFNSTLHLQVKLQSH